RDGVELIIADDGMQHYALGRDVEIAVVDGRRGFGNGRMLPAGPLREPVARLDVVDRIVINGGQARGPSELRMDLAGDTAVNLVDGRTMSLAEAARLRWHALAGIGDPDRFFTRLEASGLALIRHPFPDHAPLSPADLDFADELPVIMTEKDAVKCRPFADARCWVLPVEACFAPGDAERLLAPVLAGRRNHDANKG
ncbi:MAG: tetraacyldisaccharide 4'-kinase, partial [Gammaproteobacteria bacterium]